MIRVGLFLLFIAFISHNSGRWPLGTDSSNNWLNRPRYQPSVQLRRDEKMNSYGSTKDQTFDHSETSLLDILNNLRQTQVQPSEEEWNLFRSICSTRGRRQQCEAIFDYFKQVLLPLTMRASQSKRATPLSNKTFQHNVSQWQEAIVAGLPKYSSRSQTTLTRELATVHQFGDDSVAIGPNYMLVSDGITKDEDSDFFSLQVANYLVAGIPLIDTNQELPRQLEALIRSLEELIVEVQLPAAATLSLAILYPPHHLYVTTLGDSQVRVVRGNGQVIYTSARQRRGNVPGQLNHRKPRATDEMNFDVVNVSQGDLVIMASDGLWDNVRGDEVAALVRQSAMTSVNRVISLAVQRKSERLKGKHCDERNRTCVGGRKDDISIIVAKI